MRYSCKLSNPLRKSLSSLNVSHYYEKLLKLDSVLGGFTCPRGPRHRHSHKGHRILQSSIPSPGNQSSKKEGKCCLDSVLGLMAPQGAPYLTPPRDIRTQSNSSKHLKQHSATSIRRLLYHLKKLICTAAKCGKGLFGNFAKQLFRVDLHSTRITITTTITC